MRLLVLLALLGPLAGCGGAVDGDPVPDGDADEPPVGADVGSDAGPDADTDVDTDVDTDTDTDTAADPDTDADTDTDTDADAGADPDPDPDTDADPDTGTDTAADPDTDADTDPDTDTDTDGDADADGDSDPDPVSYPSLGVYVVGTDGAGLRLLADTGTRELSHVRRQAGTDWLVATRYGQDPDGNGLAMENEAGFGAYYVGTQIVVFRAASPQSVTVVAGTNYGGVAANASWTEDGKLLFLYQWLGQPVTTTTLERATFSQMPSTFELEVVSTPSELLVPVDPHQVGPSDATGKIVFTATFQLMPSGLWMRPVWQMPASGDAFFASTSLVGCPICPTQVPAGCCGTALIEDVLGTNDPRMNHAGTRVQWMQQHRELTATVGATTINPWRQVERVFSESAQHDIPATGVAAESSVTFGEWRADDAELVYWAIELEGLAVKNRLYTMAPDGTSRTPIPLPPELCVSHPSYFTDTEVIFTAWRCSAVMCSCDAGAP